MPSDRANYVFGCATPGCDRVALHGMERCGPCTVAYMDGQQHREAGAPIRVGIMVQPLTKRLTEQLRQIQSMLGPDGHVRVLTVQQSGIVAAVISQLERWGYLTRTKRERWVELRLTQVALEVLQ